MHQVGGSATPQASTDAWARDAFSMLSALPGVRRAGLALAEGGGRRLRFIASDRDGAPIPEWCHIDAYEDLPLNAVVRTGRPVLGTFDDLASDFPGFVARQRGSGAVGLAAVPIVAAGQTLGGYLLYFRGSQPYDAAQRADLEALGVRLGARLRRAQRSQARPTLTLAAEPVPDGAASAHTEVPPQTAAVAGVRRFLRTTLDGWGVPGDVVDDVVLCASELVTNAVIHTHGAAELRVVWERGVLTTTVRDHGFGGVLSGGGDDDPLRVHGRGLQVVDALADRWGSSLDAVGTTVWFVLETSS